ncbi:hypothetical protein Dsin_017519 [Dipteronia sinensis]|uniref:Reverse transcriptase domain-containing protein n=1 Tax=Dipteronia sinensis TaxID=43782 RepID=A0AAE0E7Z3_9ROSI|nr:hypothetical protein Dsin_017519 [Dipteronia sinensis]
MWRHPLSRRGWGNGKWLTNHMGSTTFSGRIAIPMSSCQMRRKEENFLLRMLFLALGYRRLGLYQPTGRNEDPSLECSGTGWSSGDPYPAKSEAGDGSGNNVFDGNEIGFHIDVKITSSESKLWRLMGFYGNPDSIQWDNSWTLLRRLRKDQDLHGAIDVMEVQWSKRDHRLILVEILTASDQYLVVGERRRRRFHFKACWADCEECDVLVSNSWTHSVEGGAVRRVAEAISKCGQQLGRFLGVNSEALLEEEEMYWKQRSRVDWLKGGDKNSKFFHFRATARRSRNLIEGLFDERGIWREGSVEVEKVVTKYFSGLFTAGVAYSEDVDTVLNSLQPRLSPQSCNFLDTPFTLEEIWRAVFDMAPSKAPGPNGLPAIFFQKYWTTVGVRVTEACLNCLNGWDSMRDINRTLICLIPKKSAADSKVISETQSAFVPGRLISDNAIIGLECLHALWTKKRKKGSLALKLDMSKAYDRVEWDFLSKVMLRLGFSERWVERVMGCVRTVHFSFLINGRECGSIVPTRGLRQGNPLSPYLYLMVSEGLSELIDSAVNRKEILGFRCGRSGPEISHLFFTDDSLLFSGASMRECVLIRRILDVYFRASGQLVNFVKSSMCVSDSVSRRMENRLATTIGVHIVKCHERYLGLPGFIEKEDRGINFRNFHVFNQALLAKQGWRLEQNPQSLAAKVVKSCYYPTSSFMKADKGSNGSLLWKSLCLGRELLEIGTRWRIGSSSSVSIFEDRWIPRPVTFKVFTPKVENGIWLVSHLRTETGVWNTPLIQEIFLEDNARSILSIPCSLSRREDSLCWHYTPDGNYTVKSGYSVGVSLCSTVSTSGLLYSGFCSKTLWMCHLPSKIKIFLWKAIRDWIPTHANLARRRVPVEGMCPVCSCQFETTVHALWGCRNLKKVRYRFCLLTGLHYDRSGCFPDFFFYCCQNLSKKNLEFLCVALWRIWLMRNLFVHGGRIQDMYQVVPWAEEFLAEFQDANSEAAKLVGRARPTGICWRPLEVGMLKLNTDVAIDVQNQRVGLGMVIRDDLGMVLAASTQKIRTYFSLPVAEAMTILRGTIFLKNSGLEPIVIESDALGVVQMINSATKVSADIGLIIEDIRDRLHEMSGSRVVFAYRNVNEVAHNLSKMALTIVEDLFWMESYPPCVERFV